MNTDIDKPTIDLMFDTETFSTNREQGMVVSVAMQNFKLNGKEDFSICSYYVIDPKSSEFYGRVRDEDTMKWWQSENHAEAYQHLLRDISHLARSYAQAWSLLYKEMRELSEQYTLHVWSKGIDFDFPLIESCFRSLGLIDTPNDLPYKFWNKFDVRTVLSLARSRGWQQPIKPISHSADDDCSNQIAELKEAWRFFCIISQNY